jgi:hypothetical protein
MNELKAAKWKPSPKTDADPQCEFRYQPEGWSKTYRFLALRYEKKADPPETDQSEQYQLFKTADYIYRVFATSMDRPLDLVGWFYNQRGGAEKLIKEATTMPG